MAVAELGSAGPTWEMVAEPVPSATVLKKSFDLYMLTMTSSFGPQAVSGGEGVLAVALPVAGRIAGRRGVRIVAAAAARLGRIDRQEPLGPDVEQLPVRGVVGRRSADVERHELAVVGDRVAADAVTTGLVPPSHACGDPWYDGVESGPPSSVQTCCGAGFVG